MNATPPTRGRPLAANPETLREQAISILIRDGYATATMARSAEEVGVSLRTLHRYFPTKADIVWGGIEGALDALRRGFGRADERVPIVEAISEVIVNVFAEDADEGRAVGRARLRLIATTPELEATRPETYRRWREETIAYIARRMAAPADDVMPRAAGAAVQTVIMEALAWWATRADAGDPAATVAAALRGLNALSSPVRAS